MNVKELREALAEWPDDTLVLMAKDSEGNGHSPLAEVSESMYLADSTWSGDTYPTHEYIEAHADQGYTDEDEAPEEAVRVVHLWPTN